MNTTNQEIDNYLHGERKKVVFRAVVAVLLIVPPLLWVALPPMGSKTYERGTVLSLGGNASDQGETLSLVVELSDGQEVTAGIPTVTYYRQGQDVRLLKIEPLLFGRTIYRFSGYVDGDE